MNDIMNKADLLCTTPSNTARDPVKAWKKRFASGVAVDEAGNMNRADLYGVWGNTLLPCFLFGDPRQLPPTVMTTNEKGAEGNVLNRFAADGGVSPLAFFVATGIPVYRLKTQLRMADGIFDMISKIIYADVPFKVSYLAYFIHRHLRLIYYSTVLAPRLTCLLTRKGVLSRPSSEANSLSCLRPLRASSFQSLFIAKGLVSLPTHEHCRR